MSELRKLLVVIPMVVLVVVTTNCHKQQSETEVTEQSTPAKPAASPLVGFNADLQFIKNGGYTYIYVFSRKDGKVLEPTDSEFLRTNAPQMVDWARTKEGHAVIGGTNFNLEEGNLGLLKKRFVVEDYSGK